MSKRESHLHPHQYYKRTVDAVSWLHNPLPPIVTGTGSVCSKALPSPPPRQRKDQSPSFTFLSIYRPENKIKRIKSSALLDASNIIYYKCKHI